MKDQNEKSRTTIYIDEQLVKRAEILFGEAKVNSFSAFASKAIEEYITRLVIDKNSDLLSDEIRKAIKNEIGPLGSRISKGLYRYAVRTGSYCGMALQIHQRCNRKAPQGFQPQSCTSKGHG